MNNIDSWITSAREKGASDLHIESGSPLTLRIRGDLTSVGEPIAAEPLMEMIKDLLGPKRWPEFLTQRSFDLSQTISGFRCRINAYQTLRGISLAIRVLSNFRNNLKDCNLHPDFASFLNHDTGLLLVAGPTGSGKSTTLAAFVEEVNATKRKHVITIESPIEYYFKNRRSIIRQREVKHHTPSFEQAIIDSMRQDPDVLVIGEMRTPDVMRLTLNAAETGHLVFSTIHSSTCAEALSRLCMSFPSDLQPAVCHQVADSLIGVICQRLVYYPKFQIRVPTCEVLVATSSVKAIIRSGQFSKLPSTIQTGGDDHMWSWDRYRRWADEKIDWVKPTSKNLIDDREDSPDMHVPVVLSAPPPANKTLSPKTPSAPRPKDLGESPNDPDRIEITATEEDLNELVKKMIKK